MDILNVENLSKNYKDFNLNNINFNLPKGCIMGLIGENGAGKTTTVKLILNLIKKNSGAIKIFGFDNIVDEQRIKQDLGVVLDESYFHDNLKPREISLIMDNIYKEWDKDIFFKYLKRFKLPEDKVLKDYSKGMKMKLSIAAALSHNPKLLILDEPTGGLDPVVRNEILDIFLDFIQDEEKSILFSTHVTSDLDKIADYITFLHEGNLILSEPKDDILNNYGVVKCKAGDFDKLDKNHIISYRKNRFGYEVLINNKQNNKGAYNDLIIDSVNLEDVMLFYIRRDQ
ncbi:ABC transporter ATP-binding protein [Tissierella sp. Yu-01]|uniref:ABC transporter ATP-binding protein n=1 Tax=Tissierella sp. Yu-01 TaxID=3035694 RepID=UPI00240D88D3|nr:ABC transporter ATP-binding protein [Tissierella sp. Yu-01]WFA09052.1 ABC transporter ATP-binding protein [Tissierella sp. Yu-01]